MIEKHKNIQLVVSDLDRTLLDEREEIVQEAVDLIHSLKEREVGFSLISGRPISYMEEIAQRLKVTLPMAACNGAVIFQEGVVLEEHSFPINSLRRLAEHAVAKGATVLYYTLHESFTFTETPWVISQKETIRKYQVHTPTEDEWDTIHPVKVSVLVRDVPHVWEELVPLLDEAESRHTIVRYEGRSVEITLKGRTKEKGLQRICELAGIDIEHAMAIGDEMNDFGMLSHAGVGVAVGNAVQAIKDRADWVTSSGYTQGVVEALNEFTSKTL